MNICHKRTHCLRDWVCGREGMLAGNPAPAALLKVGGVGRNYKEGRVCCTGPEKTWLFTDILFAFRVGLF